MLNDLLKYMEHVSAGRLVDVICKLTLLGTAIKGERVGVPNRIQLKSAIDETFIAANAAFQEVDARIDKGELRIDNGIIVKA